MAKDNFEKFSQKDIDNYNSLRSKIWRRCQDVTQYYYDSGLWIKGIHYISDFYIHDDTIEIIEQSQGCDLEFNLEDFVDDEKFVKAIKTDIEEYKNL